ncbi:MAG: hypothetical protein ABI609_07055 [Acidobacteriota bacterium]
MTIERVNGALRGVPPSTRLPIFIAATLWSGCAAFWVWRLQGWTVDDFFISYRYVANLAAGRGLVYNLGERVFGVTDPGLALLLGFLRWITGWRVEMLASAVFGAALVGFCVVILRAEIARGAGLVAFIAGTLLVNSTLLWTNNGAAAPLCALLLTIAALQAPKRALLAGTLAGLAVWVRPDAALAMPVLAWLQLRTSRRGAMVSTLAAGLVILAGLLAANSYFGRPLPQTLHAKTQMTLGHGENLAGLNFWPAAADSFRRHLGRPWALAILASVAGLPLLFRAASAPLRLISALALLLAIAYPILGVPYFSWYSILEIIAGTYAAVTIVARLTRWCAQGSGLGTPRAFAAITTLLSVLLFLPALGRSYAMARDYTPPQRLVIYRDAGLWLRAHSQPDDRVAHTEVGVLGYYSERPIVDLMGLVSPQPRAKRTLAIPRGLRSSAAEFVLHRAGGRSEDFVHRPWFTEAYESVAEFPDPQARSESLVIFRRR